MTSSWLKTSIASIALIAASGAAMAEKANDTLRVAFTKELENVDSYFNSSREGVVLQRAVWDGLIYRDPVTNEYKGNLATSWEWIDDTTLEFKLREGVTFHNGEPFNADDVVYTVNFVAKEENGVKTQRNVNWMESAEKIDDYTVRIHLKDKFPAAIEFLSGPVSMYPDEYYAEVGPSGMGLKPVGTGPYEVVSVVPGQHFVLKKYEGYHDSPKGAPEITNIDIRTIPDVNTQLAELFSGSLDLIWQVPADQAEKMSAMDQFTVMNESTMRVGYLSFDAAGRSGDSPFGDLRVRRAINHAINREELVNALLKGKSKVIWTPCFPSQFGCVEEAATTYEYDPEKARALLAEAGYPDGFETEFYAYRDREYAEAILSYLNAVGIDADFKFLQYSALRELNMKGEVPMSFQTWGSYSINDASAMVSQFFKHGSLDDARDDQVLADLNVADSATDPDTRVEHYAKAIERITDQAYWAPMFSYNTNYVFTKEVEYTPTADEVLRFTTMSWN
ncbi:ABC transporter substrate-binding protein [Lutimaribacter sp. EGI FJ00015]|uniref:ABC transporter substrate-binding protein n=1 Tax=Lutimaribacter degradans TaxID=2945989 RepID=A0ACC5ZTJ6_9RHOB|nr:ABC transporter substrate-binding protein [Lutimaribacter sp. EGI FJ00013]MCM2561652.1 ABC transporter substrate-binding protein [Lutimaribacter sp. EGI FJ00013]MCO0612636.1 ABC transporter substrate-binding protein [Lutimaribacter sp. EGI FJ00015]MCO0635294.1 ABC transporter substrate-binding protein [Lutimaribacter sp. EGI FJ00014]